MKNTELEEAANNYITTLDEPEIFRKFYIEMFKAGANWQKEQQLKFVNEVIQKQIDFCKDLIAIKKLTYTEEEVKQLLLKSILDTQDCDDTKIMIDKKLFEKWFEQNKKK